MATNHTEHYDLNQWEKSDKVLMEDFNADNEKIDAALKTQADALAAEKSARESAVAAEKAAREAAATAASSALATAVNHLGNCRVERFTVQSGGSGVSNTIQFSGKPVVFLAYVSDTLMVCHGGNSGERTSGVVVYYAPGYVAINACTYTWSGFQATIINLDPMGRSVPYSIVAFYAEDAK